MAESRKPRHIRDIAHLYLSRLQSPSHGPRATLLITSSSKKCFSGFHAANIAAAFASKCMNTILFELSGLLPNAGYFMALPPQRYIRWSVLEGERAIPALAGIKLSFSLRTHTGFGRNAGRPRIDLIHLPPVFPAQPFQTVLESLQEQVDKQAAVLFFDMDAGGDGGLVKSALGRDTEWVIFNANLDSETSAIAAEDRSNDLGHLGYWESRLHDRVPIVIRVPESALARTYSSMCDTILLRLNHSIKKAGATHASRIPRNIQPG
jgi:hypothetical protein